jgi:hypothetical protein
MKMMNKKNGKSAFGCAVRRVGMACLFVLGVWCMTTSCDEEEDEKVKGEIKNKVENKPLTGQSGTIKSNTVTLIITVGTIEKDSDGYTTVELLGVPAWTLAPLDDRTVLDPKIMAGGSTFEANKFTPTKDGMKYYYPTKRDPDKIIVYYFGSSVLVFGK